MGSFESMLSNDVLNLLWKKLRIGWVNKMLGQFLNPELTNVLINIIKFIIISSIWSNIKNDQQIYFSSIIISQLFIDWCMIEQYQNSNLGPLNEVSNIYGKNQINYLV